MKKQENYFSDQAMTKPRFLDDKSPLINRNLGNFENANAVMQNDKNKQKVFLQPIIDSKKNLAIHY